MVGLARIPLIWLLCLLSVLLHELGHALGYRLSAGKAGWRVVVGSGPRIAGAPRVDLHLVPVGGYFLPGEAIQTKKGKLATLAGGPVASLLLAVLYWALCSRVPALVAPGSALRPVLLPAFSFLFYFNLFQFFFTVVPVRYRIVCRGMESDGLQFVRVLKQKDLD